MEAKLQINVAEAIETYYNLIDYNTVNGFRDGHPSVVFTAKLRAFLIEEGIELK